MQDWLLALLPMAEPVANLIVSLAGDYNYIVAPATTDADNVERPIYAGNAIQTIKSSDAKKVISFRTV